MTLGAGFHRLTAEAYHADPAPAPSLSASVARELVARSSLHAWHAHPRLNPNFKPQSNSILDAGTIAHAILLEGGTSRLVVVQSDDWRKKEAREQRDQAWANGGIPVLAAKLGVINEMVQTAKEFISRSELAGVFDRGDAELSMLWEDGYHGRDQSNPLGYPTWCRARPDWLTSGREICVDYKSTATVAEPNTFSRQIVTMGYDLAVGHYRRGFRALGINPDWIFLVQENESPFACSLVGMSPANLDLADRKADYALTCWKHCMSTGQWKGYPSRVCYAEPPEYAVRQWEERQTLDELIEQGSQI